MYHISCLGYLESLLEKKKRKKNQTADLFMNKELKLAIESVLINEKKVYH